MGLHARDALLYTEVSSWQRSRGLELMREARPEPGEQVLDIGCSTGCLTSRLAQRVQPGGAVIGVDPTHARLELARARVPLHLDSLSYVEGHADDLSWIHEDSIDLVYSNYAFHWIPDKETAFKEIWRCLRTGGRCAIEAGRALPSFFAEAHALCVSLDKKVMAKLSFLDEQEWCALLQKIGYVIDETAGGDSTLHFDSLEDFYDWYEAVTHGAFRRSGIATDDHLRLQRTFNGGRDITIPTVRIIAHKPH